ncbi:hypothetical protein W02_16670 [Nitrospira sp. KM1]|nr:hypothetical protein W02_16670 [Nitrospira sp. KM1]
MSVGKGGGTYGSRALARIRTEYGFVGAVEELIGRKRERPGSISEQAVEEGEYGRSLI